MSVLNNWWLLPSLITILVGIICPAIGTALIYRATHPPKLSKDIQILAHSSPAEILRQMRNKKASWETR